MHRRAQLLLIYTLTALGLLQSVGYLIGSDKLVFFALATKASPLPDVFGGSSEFEPIPYMAEFEFNFVDGTTLLVPKAEYTDLLRKRGPTGRFFRYIGYVTAINWLPLIPEDSYRRVLQHGFCRGGAIAELLQIKKPVSSVTVNLINAKPDGRPDLHYTIPCSA